MSDFDIKKLHAPVIVENAKTYNREIDIIIESLQKFKIDINNEESLEYRNMLSISDAIYKEYIDKDSVSAMSDAHTALKNLINSYSFIMEHMARRNVMVNNDETEEQPIKFEMAFGSSPNEYYYNEEHIKQRLGQVVCYNPKTQENIALDIAQESFSTNLANQHILCKDVTTNIYYDVVMLTGKDLTNLYVLHIYESYKIGNRCRFYLNGVKYFGIIKSFDESRGIVELQVKERSTVPDWEISFYALDLQKEE